MEHNGAVVKLLPEPQQQTLGSGGVNSVQQAEVSLPPELLDRFWRPEYLERLARSYWRFLSRISLSLIRVVYRPQERQVVLLTRRLPLLTFHAPEYETAPDSGSVSWRIHRGVLVAREGRDSGFLRIAVRRLDPGADGRARLEISVQVRNFYPLLRGRGWFARFGSWFYAQTQLRIHRWITYGFLRSLARLDLPPSRVGSFTAEIDEGGGRAEVSVGSGKGTNG
jgi:hypothetical protein